LMVRMVVLIALTAVWLALERESYL
jgi:hypothetical protein